MKLKIGYFADGVWSHKAFEKIKADDVFDIQFICVRFDTNDLVLKALAHKHNIDYLKHSDINSQEFIETIKTYNCDLFVSMSFNQIFKKEIINIPRLKTINCHAGKLPFYRGRNVLNWVLINDESSFGITVHYVDEGIDTGDIILQREYPITDEDDYKSLLQTAHNECATILYDALVLLRSNRVAVKKQTDIHPMGFYCTKRDVGDELLNWNQSSREIFNFIRALCQPSPMARAFINGKEMKINRALYLSEAPSFKGHIGAILGKDETGFLVKTNDSFIKIIDYDYQGKFTIGDRFEI